MKAMTLSLMAVVSAIEKEEIWTRAKNSSTIKDDIEDMLDNINDIGASKDEPDEAEAVGSQDIALLLEEAETSIGSIDNDLVSLIRSA